jgi:hypothetical protein
VLTGRVLGHPDDEAAAEMATALAQESTEVQQTYGASSPAWRSAPAYWSREITTVKYYTADRQLEWTDAEERLYVEEMRQRLLGKGRTEKSLAAVPVCSSPMRTSARFLGSRPAPTDISDTWLTLPATR